MTHGTHAETPPHPCDAERRKITALVRRQAEDEGLWFEAQTAPEAYLQQELRRLHAAIEQSIAESPLDLLQRLIARP